MADARSSLVNTKPGVSSKARRKRRAHRTAIHEAGHAVMAYLSGRRIGAMSATPTGEILGQLEYRGFTWFPAHALDDLRARRKVETEIMIAMAGLAAEHVHARPVNLAGAVVDVQRALDIALAATEDAEEATAFVNWLFVRARNRLRVPACVRAVKKLAAELARRGSLSAIEVRTLLRRSLD